MSFALSGKEGVRPFLLLPGQGDGSRKRSARPVGWSGLNAPNVANRFEGNPNQPILAFVAKWDGAGYTPANAAPARKFIEQNGCSGLKVAGEPDTAALGIHDHGVTALAELNRRVETRHQHRDLSANSGAVSCRFVCSRSGRHKQSSSQILRRMVTAA